MMTPYELEAYSRSPMLRRFYSGSGRRIPFRNIIHAPQSLGTTLLLKMSGRRPQLPFIPYEAIRLIAARLPNRAVGVEVGAGMSTFWLASRVAKLDSYEWNDTWYRLVRDRLSELNVSNVSLIKNSEHEHMEFNVYSRGSLDLIFIDGGPRSMCLANLWEKLRSGGLAYLDNWDSDLFWLEGGYDARKFVAERDSEIRSRALIVDYVPTQFAVSEGLLLQKR